MGREDYIKKYGTPQVNFIETESTLRVTINTNRLKLAPITMEELENYYTHLFGNPKAMKKYGNTQIRDRKKIQSMIEEWVNRWNSKNPFSGLVVRSRQGTFLGHVILGEADEPNASELACLMRKEVWGQGYGFEVVGAVVFFYTPELTQRGYKPPQQTSFKRIIATARPDNEASEKILKKLGFAIYKQSEKYDHERNHYELIVNNLE